MEHASLRATLVCAPGWHKGDARRAARIAKAQIAEGFVNGVLAT